MLFLTSLVHLSATTLENSVSPAVVELPEDNRPK
jgi:hypothetical protein